MIKLLATILAVVDSFVAYFAFEAKLLPNDILALPTILSIFFLIELTYFSLTYFFKHVIVQKILLSLMAGFIWGSVSFASFFVLPWFIFSLPTVLVAFEVKPLAILTGVKDNWLWYGLSILSATILVYFIILIIDIVGNKKVARTKLS